MNDTSHDPESDRPSSGDDRGGRRDRDGRQGHSRDARGAGPGRSGGDTSSGDRDRRRGDDARRGAGESRGRQDGGYRGKPDGTRGRGERGRPERGYGGADRDRRAGDRPGRRDDRAPARDGRATSGARGDGYQGPARAGEGNRGRYDRDATDRRRGGTGPRDDRRGGDRGGHAPRAGAGRDREGFDRRPEPRHPAGPAIPDEVQISQLDRAARGRLRTLSKETAEVVGRHLVMAGRLIDSDPELAYEHAQAAVRRAGRVDVAREAAGLTAYATGRYAEALRELRTVRRLNGSSEHLPIMADCERGLGRPERALALAASEEAATLDEVGRTELAIVVSGARVDLGELDAALAALEQVPAVGTRGELGARVLQARASVLEVAGRTEEAAEILAGIDASLLAAALGEEDDVVVYDLTDELEESEQLADEGPGATEDAAPSDGADR